MILDPDYARIFTQARVIAWNYGYTCAAIGSYTRDLDLLLVPWTEQATANHEQLLKLIAQSCGLRFRDGEEDILKAKPDFINKPHGRMSCSLFFPGPYDRRWVDIGIVPCASIAGSASIADRALMQQALEALENLFKGGVVVWALGGSHQPSKTIAALRERLQGSQQ